MFNQFIVMNDDDSVIMELKVPYHLRPLFHGKNRRKIKNVRRTQPVNCYYPQETLFSLMITISVVRQKVEIRGIQKPQKIHQ